MRQPYRELTVFADLAIHSDAAAVRLDWRKYKNRRQNVNSFTVQWLAHCHPVQTSERESNRPQMKSRGTIYLATLRELYIIDQPIPSE